MSKKSILRLKALQKKSEATLTDEEKQELATLTKEAADNNVDLKSTSTEDDGEDDGDDTKDHDSSETTEEKLTEIITKAVAAGNKEDSEAVAKAVTDLLKEQGNGKVTTEDIEGILSKHLEDSKIDPAAIAKLVSEGLPKDALTASGLKEALEDFAKSVRGPQKMDFGDPFNASFPIEHRSGNLSVGEKQLLNICLMHISDEKKAEMVENGQKIPTSMNDGITDDQLKYARQQGALNLKSIRNDVKYGKAITTQSGGASGGSGGDLIPTDLSGQLLNRMYLSSQLASEMIAQEIDMPTSPFEMPLRTTRTSFYVGSEAPGSDPTESTPGTATLTLNAKKLIGYSEYSYEADEDSIIAVLPMLLDNMSQGAADALEGALVNGDTTAPHMDVDINAVTAHSSRLFKGFRKLALAGSVTTSLATGNISTSNIAAMRKLMLRWGIKPSELMLLVGPKGYNDVVSLAETLTFDKVGNSAATRILTGEAGSIFGIRIVISSQVREDLNASGVYDGSTTTKGSILLVHKPSFIVGVKRGFMVEVDVNKKRQINEIIASFRRDFIPKETPSTTIPTVVLGYNNVA